jgi:hypothetical protein
MRRELLGANRARRGASSTSVWRTALVVALGALGAVSSAHGQASTLRIAVSQGLDGAFASPPCASAPPAAELATRAATVRAAVDRGAIAVDTGSFLGVAAIGQMAIVHDSEGLASAVRASGLSALALARRDLAAPRAILVRAAEAFRRASTPYVLSNLACDAPAADVCAPIVDASDPPHLVRVAGQRVAVISAVHPSALTHVANDRAASLSLQDPAPALARATRAARASGAERVIAIYDPRRDEALEDALAVARAIAPRDAPDVLLVNDIASSVERITVAEHQRMHLVATRDAVTELELTEDGARSAAATAHAPVPEAIAFERAMAQTICREESRSLRGARLVSPIDPSGLLGLFADVLRSYARADVSVINQGVIDRRRFRSLRGRLRRLDVLLAVPFDNAIRVTRVKGSALRAAFTAAARQQFLFRGLELEGSAVRVNGRALEDDAEYVVSATDFVADTNALGQGTHVDSVRPLQRARVALALSRPAARARSASGGGRSVSVHTMDVSTRDQRRAASGAGDEPVVDDRDRRAAHASASDLGERVGGRSNQRGSSRLLLGEHVDSEIWVCSATRHNVDGFDHVDDAASIDQRDIGSALASIGVHISGASVAGAALVRAFAVRRAVCRERVHQT